MKVICKTNTKKLVKGATYDVLQLTNINTSGHTYFRPYIVIKITDATSESYSVNNFTTVDGKNLPETNWTSPSYLPPQSYIDTSIDETIKKGDYVCYRHNKSTTFHKGSVYLVTDVKIDKKEYITHWTGVPQKHVSTTIFIKVEGSNRWIKSYSFQKAPSDVARNIALQKILDEKTDAEKAGTIRKIDKYTGQQKERIIFRVISESIIDPNRNNMSILDWAIKKCGSVYGITLEDLQPILNKNLNTIITELS